MSENTKQQEDEGTMKGSMSENTEQQEDEGIMQGIRNRIASIASSTVEISEKISFQGLKHDDLLTMSLQTFYEQPFMKAAFVNGFTNSLTQDLIVADDQIRKPMFDPKSSMVLVQIIACSLNPYDIEIMQGKLDKLYPVNFPYVPGHDISGQVLEVADECSDFFHPGDLVWGAIPAGRGGGLAEYIVLEETYLWKKPETLSFYQAAGLGSSAVTAYKIFIDELDFQSGQNLLILGGHTGVGSIAIQLGIHMGAGRMTVEARPETHGMMRHLGAGRNGSILPYNLQTDTFAEYINHADILETNQWWDHLEKEMEARNLCDKRHKKKSNEDAYLFDAVIDCDCHPENWEHVEPYLAKGAKYIACDSGVAHMDEPIGYKHIVSKSFLKVFFACNKFFDDSSPTWHHFDVQDELPAPMVLFRLSKMVRDGQLRSVLDTSTVTYTWESIHEMFERQKTSQFVGKLAFKVQEGGKGHHLHVHKTALQGKNTPEEGLKD